MTAQLLAGVEAGGTKVLALLGAGPDDTVAELRIPTTTPDETIGAVVDFFAAQAEAGNVPVAGGIATFGPVELRRTSDRFGFITTTPKPGWSNTDLLGPIEAALGVPVGFDTDVNGAALGEGRWGAAQGLNTFVYLTVGTGIGGGAVVNGEVAHGLVHAEMGHVFVPRHPDDDFEGRCPFHRACFEGMASGPALADRWGTPAEELAGADLDKAVEIEAFYIAAGLSSTVYILAPERILIGGGVAELPGLFPAVRKALTTQLAGYPGLPEHGSVDFVMPPELGAMAGPAGALALAELALAASTGI
jgi:fructokinase